MTNTEKNIEIRHGYKKTKLGWIPDEWQVKKLSDLTSKIGSGITPKGGSKVYTSNGHPFLRSQNIGWGRLLLKDIAHIPKDIHESMSSTKLKLGDVLLNITGASIGRSALVTEEVDDGNVNQHVCIIRPKNYVIDEEFLNLFLISWGGQKQIESLQAGGNRQGLNFQQIGLFKIPIPSVSEQKKIAQIFSYWDVAISKINKIIKAKKRYKKGLMQRLLSGSVRFPEFEGEDWIEVKLGDITKVISSNLDKKIKEGQEDVRLCNYMDVYNNAIIDSSLSFMESTASEREIEKYTLKQDDVIITKDSETPDDIASASVVKKLDSRVLCGYHLAILRPNKEKVLGDFLAKQIMTFAYRKQFFQRANGATRYGLRISDIESAKFNIPTLKEQERISSLLNSVNKEISILNKEKLALEKQKKGLMQKLLTGKVRVN